MLLASVAVVIAIVCTKKRRMDEIEDFIGGVNDQEEDYASLTADHAADFIFLHDSWGYADKYAAKMKAKREELRFLRK